MVIEMIERFTCNGRAQKWMYTLTAVLNLKKHKKTYVLKNLSSEKKKKEGSLFLKFQKIIFYKSGYIKHLKWKSSLIWENPSHKNTKSTVYM